MDTTKIKAALDTQFNSTDLDAVTVREYLKTLLRTLLDEGESFSGKRPFGNSGWEDELAVPLIRTGVISGEIDEEDGSYASDYNEAEYAEALAALVDAL